MRRFNIIVNGKSYDVAVEELAAGSAPAPVAAPPAPVAPPVAPKPPVAAPAAPPAAAPTNAEKVESPMPGTILDVKVKLGDTVKEGATLVILEAMKMENEILAPCAGKVVSLNVKKGDSVEAGTIIASVG